MISAPTENERAATGMAEYIEREAAIRFLLNDSPEQVNYSREDAADCIRYMNAADVAPVVRCRDCKHAWIHPCGYVYCHRDGRNAYEMTFNLDSFCSYGERKDNG